MAARALFALALGLVLWSVPAQALVENFIRPDFQNLSGPATVEGRDANPGLIPMQGSIQPAEAAPTDGAQRLTEASFGQPFSPFVFSSETDPSSTHAAQIVAEVRAELYPSPGSNRAQVLSGGTAFRYKWLLFSPDPDAEDTSDVTTHFQGMDEWFGDDERAKIDEQILILRDALAVSPLNTELRDLLLDSYYDLAIAEMQFAKQHLANLAAKHLGLEVTSPFVIDEEIEIFETLVELEAGVLQRYSELLSMNMTGIDPSDFDDRESPGTPMGLYLFLAQQPYRNATASQYATETGTEVIPEYDEVTKAAKPRDPENLVLFSGYKDYVAMLTIMGRYTIHQAELARLRGMRQGPNDLTEARNAISKIQSETATDFLLLRSLFHEFPPGDASGVNAAINGVETGLADITNVRSFINGTANLLGLDPNFLLLVQSSADFNNESFDILFSQLKGPNQPLGNALAKLDDATDKYQNFRASVDKVVAELAAVDSTFEDRYIEITGYAVDEVPGFDGYGKPNSGSELDLVEQSIQSLRSRNITLRELTAKIAANLREAQRGLTIAKNLNTTIENAKVQYTTQVRSAFDEIAEVTALAEVNQVIFDGLLTAASLDASARFSGGDIAVGVGVALNATAQYVASKSIIQRERDIDLAAVAFESEQQKADNALTVNQAQQEVGAIFREQHANTLEITDNALALAQAIAQRTALLGEVKRIEANQEGDSATVRNSYYADPIQFVRSENALILADAAFRNAQRWVFYTQRAVEYKWQQKFASTEGIRSFDSGSLFKMRNAEELDDLLTQLKNWDMNREALDVGNARTSFISMLDDVLTPNPNLINLTPALRADPGVRVDLRTGDTVSQLELFHRLLDRGLDSAGNINIDFDTTQLDTLQADFFVGPNYSSTPIAPGEWRDKIVYLKVNIVAEDGTEIPENRGGNLTYGGQTFFRTRIPPCVDRSVGISDEDFAGEFLTAPFRYFNSPSYNNVFVSENAQSQNITAAYTGATAKSPTGEEILAETYQINAFNQRSVATTRWRLTLFAPDTGWDLSKLKDIELIVRHQSSARSSPICN